MPIRLHAIPQRHPQLRLLWSRHAFPSLLNTRERRIRDGVGSSVPFLLDRWLLTV